MNLTTIAKAELICLLHETLTVVKECRSIHIPGILEEIEGIKIELNNI